MAQPSGFNSECRMDLTLTYVHVAERSDKNKYKTIQNKGSCFEMLSYLHVIQVASFNRLQNGKITGMITDDHVIRGVDAKVEKCTSNGICEKRNISSGSLDWGIEQIRRFAGDPFFNEPVGAKK